MSGSDAVIRVVPIVNARGLHARASAKLTRLAVKFDADITVSKDGYTVSARSIMGLLTLGAAMKKAGLGRLVDRMFTPHVTLLYDGRLVTPVDVKPVAWKVNEFVLFARL